jgi:ParB family chromosome partitioning protein
MRLLDIDIIAKGPYTAPFHGLSPIEQQQARLSGIAAAVHVRTRGAQQFEIIGDPKPWYLAQAIQQNLVPAINVDHLSDEELRAMARTENDRAGVIEQAEDITARLPEYNSKAALGRALGLSRSSVCNLVRIDAMGTVIKEQIRSHPDTVSLGHAKILAGLDSTQQSALLKQIIQLQLSVQATALRAKAVRENTALPESDEAPSKPVEVVQLEHTVGELIGCQAEIDMGQGKLIIDYRSNLDVLDGVLARLGYRAD